MHFGTNISSHPTWEVGHCSSSSKRDLLEEVRDDSSAICFTLHRRSHIWYPFPKFVLLVFFDQAMKAQINPSSILDIFLSRHYPDFYQIMIDYSVDQQLTWGEVFLISVSSKSRLLLWAIRERWVRDKICSRLLLWFAGFPVSPIRTAKY